MKRFPFFVISVGLLILSLSSASASPWDDMTQLANSIKHTSFPNKTFNIVKFGARENNPSIKNTKAINAAIVACNKKGGGIVLIPKGIFQTGPITLLSNVNLHLEKGAVLLFSTNPEEYLPTVITRWEGSDCMNYHPLIYAYKANNIAITGQGEINGQASFANWWAWNAKCSVGYKKGTSDGHLIGRARLLKLNEDNVPITQRQMGSGNYLRPQLINLILCNAVLIDSVKLRNSPFWVIHPLLSNDIIVSNVNIESLGPNGDGCDPESCKNVLIQNCSFNEGDDCIAIKSGRNNDGRHWNIPSENIIVRDCQMKAGHGGISVGSEISGGFKNLYVDHCEMSSPDLGTIIRLKSNTCRGGLIENVFVRDVKVGQCKEDVLKINLRYDPAEPSPRGFIPMVRNVNLKNVSCKRSDYGVSIDGLDDASRVSSIHLQNCDFTGVKFNGNDIQGANDVTLNNIRINNIIITNEQISTDYDPHP
ncbi:glycoside hydrolase family 28 protein [Microbacter margulisiae]|uniref:Polygalacturonase n=1 Tax=Microbacter margulisiae TaxID=1350067 RepID=A0A7W5H1T9_9PORP|nr:glycoside hydrolase family 28 protein [Microbacter margulisiae]MBB3187968.1 polygalacturonase [Microbacter margulisiae]